MTDHVTLTPGPVAGTPHAGDHGEHHDAHHDGGHDDSPEAIGREKRKYLIVFGMLAILTVLTVMVSRLQVSHVTAVIIALVIASVKGSLVAAFFMHLINERKLVISVLLLTAFFFGVLMWGPWHHVWEVRGHSNHSAPAPEHQPAGH